MKKTDEKYSHRAKLTARERLEIEKLLNKPFPTTDLAIALNARVAEFRRILYRSTYAARIASRRKRSA